MKKYLAYGSNMNIKDMYNRGEDIKLIGKGRIENYKLVFRGEGHANIEKSLNNHVDVIIWEIGPLLEAELDSYEEYPLYYKKENIDVLIENMKISCMTYVMTNKYKNIKKIPSKNYLDTIRSGYIENDIDLGNLENFIEANYLENKE